MSQLPPRKLFIFRNAERDAALFIYRLDLGHGTEIKTPKNNTSGLHLSFSLGPLTHMDIKVLDGDE